MSIGQTLLNTVLSVVGPRFYLGLIINVLESLEKRAKESENEIDDAIVSAFLNAFRRKHENNEDPAQ